MNENADIIKEFLVSVGFRIDESSIKKFGSQFGEIGRRVAILGMTLTAAAAAIEIFVTKMAGGMENLYWSSQRLRSSVSDIQDYALGIQNLGGTAEGARSSLENLARMIRTNPGTGALVGALGVNPNQGSVGMMEQLGQRFRRMPYFIANMYASRLGIDEQTLWAMTHARGSVSGSGGNGSSSIYGEIYKSAGINADKAAKASKDFMQQVRYLEAEFTVLGQTLAYHLLPVAKDLVEWGQKFITTINEQLADGGKLSEMFKDMKPIIKDIGVVADSMMKIAGIFGSLLSTMPKEAVEYGLLGFILFGKKAAGILAIVGGLVSFANIVDRWIGDEDKPNEGKVSEAGTSWKYGINRWLKDHGLGYLNTNEFNASYGAYQARSSTGEQIKDTHLNQDALLSLVRKLEGSGDNAVSPAGAIGRYQIMPNTALQYGFDPSKLKDPAYNEMVARSILGKLSRDFGSNLRDILIAYNAGPGRVDAFRKTGWLPDETQKYLAHATKEVSLHQTNTYHITGGNAKETSGLVMDKQNESSGLLVRNLKGAVQ